MKAKWRRLCYTMSQLEGMEITTSFVFRIIGVSVLSIYPDWMHCKQLGFDKPLFGYDKRVLLMAASFEYLILDFRGSAGWVGLVGGGGVGWGGRP